MSKRSYKPCEHPEGMCTPISVVEKHVLVSWCRECGALRMLGAWVLPRREVVAP